MEFLKVWYRNADDRYCWILTKAVTVNLQNDEVVYGMYKLDTGEWFELTSDYISIERCKIETESVDK